MIIEEKKKTIKKLFEEKILVTPKILEEINKTQTYQEYFDRKNTKNNEIQNKNKSQVKILQNYEIVPNQKDIKDSIQYFKKRYEKLKNMLLQRQELIKVKVCSINKINTQTETIGMIVMIDERRETQNKNILLNGEDLTGSINCIINQNNKELFKEAKEVVVDEVVGLVGKFSRGLFFVEKIIFPDVPNSPYVKRSNQDCYVAFMSDIHIGSKQFMKKEFERFIKWTQGKIGNKTQKELSKKLKYIIVAGDLVDGIGIYLDQKDQLVIQNLTKQYEELVKYLKQIPSHIQIILSPGNHDGVQIFEPQEALGKKFSEKLLELPNVINVSNPGVVNIGSTETFEGFDVLIYHGYSFDHYVSEIQTVRTGGGYDAPNLIMKSLLRKRHLGPAHTSTLPMHTSDKDRLIIDEIPDIFVTGHVHRTNIDSYKNILLVNASCWQGLTPFQERCGHIPQPAQLPLFNLKTREIKLLKFMTNDGEK